MAVGRNRIVQEQVKNMTILYGDGIVCMSRYHVMTVLLARSVSQSLVVGSAAVQGL